MGIYRFDSVTVRGSAWLRFYDLDEFGSVDVEEGSTLEVPNREAPTIDPDAIHLETYGGVFRIVGGPGAITDPTGIGTALVVNRTTGFQTGAELVERWLVPPQIVRRFAG